MISPVKQTDAGPCEPPVTLVITSFNRFDLLEQTLDTFFLHNDYPLARAIVIEDSQNLDFFRVMERYKSKGVEPMFNEQRLGQHRSIDRAYSTVETEFIFHCEDDYLFGRPGIIRESMEILQSDSDILMVLPRQKEDLPYYLDSVPVRSIGNARYRKVGPKFHHLWYTFSFNAGLRRLSDYRMLPAGYGAFAKGKRSAGSTSHSARRWRSWSMGRCATSASNGGRSRFRSASIHCTFLKRRGALRNGARATI